MFRLGVPALALTLAVAAAPAFAADARDALPRARMLYNQRQFDQAIAAAGEARTIPGQADRADLVAARALLERYRAGQVADDLTLARERLRGLDPSRFTPTERAEYIVGLGEALYLDGSTGASAVIFESLLMGPRDVLLDARERVIDWWATALDHDARLRPDIERQGVYQRIRDRMSIELAADTVNAAASYWTAAAARAQGDLQAAWDAAQAGWVRAPLTRDRGIALRGDLDSLVVKAVVPERARMLAQPAETLLTEWEQFKERWAALGGPGR